MIAFFLFFVGSLALIFSLLFLAKISFLGEIIIILFSFFLLLWFCSMLVEKYHKNLSPQLVTVVRWTRAIALDFFCQSFVMTLIPFAWIRLRSKGKKSPIILIHGYFHFGLIFLYLFTYLKRRKEGPIYTFNLGSPRKSIQEYAEKLNKTFGHLPKMRLVGHSLGGLVAGYFLIHHAKEKQVEKLITMGTPFQGTKSAYFGIGKCARQMEPTHPLPKKIFTQISQLSTPLYHIETEQDEIVPFPSVPDRKNLHVITSVGHVGILFTKKCGKLLYQFLKK